MSRSSRKGVSQPSLIEVATKTAPCVPAIKNAVRTWAASGYAGAHPDIEDAAELLVPRRPSAAQR